MRPENIRLASAGPDDIVVPADQIQSRNVATVMITATLPPFARNGDKLDITVTSNGLTSPTTSADLIIYTGANPIPTISSVTPSSGTSGTVVTISGSCFSGATSVTFGGVAGTSLSVTNDQTITVTVPTNSSAAGTAVDVLVVSPCGTSASGTNNGRFSYTGSAGGATITFQLYFRWTLIAWEGVDGASVATVLKGLESPVDDAATNDVSTIITAIYFWDSPIQDYKGYFTSAVNIPGANQFSTMTKGQAYWIAVTVTTSWVTHRGQ